MRLRSSSGEDEVRAHARQVFDGAPARWLAAHRDEMRRGTAGEDGRFHAGTVAARALPGEGDIGANPGSAGTKQCDASMRGRQGRASSKCSTRRRRSPWRTPAKCSTQVSGGSSGMGGGSQEGWGRLTCGVVELELEPRGGCGQISSQRHPMVGATRRPRRGRRRQRRRGRRGGDWKCFGSKKENEGSGALHSEIQRKERNTRGVVGDGEPCSILVLFSPILQQHAAHRMENWGRGTWCKNTPRGKTILIILLLYGLVKTKFIARIRLDIYFSRKIMSYN